MNCNLIHLNDSFAWKKYLSMLPCKMQDVYYTPEYYSLYEQYGDGKACCYIFEKDGNIALYPFLLNHVNCLGYSLNKEYFDIQGAYGYNGIISSSMDSDFISSFYTEFDGYCKEKNIIAEFTRFHPLLENHRFSQLHMEVLYDRPTMYINLQGQTYESIFSRFQTTTKKQIRRAKERYNIKVINERKSTQHLDIFLEIYHEAMNRVNSVPYLYFNRTYFEHLLLNVDSILLTAYYENKPIASIIALLGSDIIHGHLGGAKTEYLHLSAYSLLYEEMIRYGLKHRKSYFHAGGGATNNENDPLLMYKLHFSNTTGDFMIGKKTHNQPVYEDVVRQWEQKAGAKKEMYRHQLLKYRI